MVFQELLDSETRIRKLSGWVEKTPSHLHQVQSIRDNIDSPLFIFTRRSAPGNIASLHKLQHDWYRANPDKQDVAYAVGRWVYDTALSACRYGQNDSFWFDYDEAILNPADAIEKLETWLNLKDGYKIKEEMLGEAAKQLIDRGEYWKDNNLHYIIKKREQSGIDKVVQAQSEKALDMVCYLRQEM